MNLYAIADEERIHAAAQVREWTRSGLLGASQGAAIETGLRTDLKRTNRYLRVALFIFGTIVVAAAFGFWMVAFGVSREKLAEALASQSRLALVSETAPGRLEGYGFIRPGSRANYLGPIVAASDEVGLQLVQALLAITSGERVFWDIPDSNTAAVYWARQHGCNQQRMLTRMYLGENTAPGNPRQQFALAGPEVG